MYLSCCVLVEACMLLVYELGGLHLLDVCMGVAGVSFSLSLLQPAPELCAQLGEYVSLHTRRRHTCMHATNQKGTICCW